jgi:hypothetical protein
MISRCKLTHTANNGLVGIFVVLHGEGGIFFGQFGECHTQLIKVLLCLRLNGNTDYGIGEYHTFQNDRVLFITQRVTRTDIFETYGSGDIPSFYLVDLLLLVSVHLVKREIRSLLPERVFFT